MKRRLIPTLALAGVFAIGASSAWAAQETTTTTTTTNGAAATDNNAVSEANIKATDVGGMKDESIGLKPEIGAIAFQDATGDSTLRGAIGLAYDMNFSRIFAGANDYYFGLSTGGMYSHLGSPGSNFFGTDPGTLGSSGGANMVMIPLDAKLGYNINDAFRVSAHGGGNVLYASTPAALGVELGSDASNNWNIFPNVGGDVDFALARNVALTLRPDWTLSPGTSFFTGTLELGISLG